MDYAATARVALETASAVVATPATALGIFGPLIAYGPVGIVLAAIIFRFKIQPTYVFDDAKAQWDRERDALVKDRDTRLAEKDAEIAELKSSLAQANKVYTEQAIPLLTRVYDLLTRDRVGPPRPSHD